MNNTVVINIVRFIGLLLLQVLILDQIDFLGYIDPYLYIVFIALFPFTGNRLLLILLGFLLGWFVDIFNDTGGIHAAASVTIAYLRPFMLKLSFGTSYEYQAIKFSRSEVSARMTYLLILVVVHHLIVFSLDYFAFWQILVILKKTIFTAAFTLILIWVFLALTSSSKR